MNGNNDISKSTSWNELKTALSHLEQETTIFFLNDIFGPLIDSLNYSSFVGKLSISQRQGIISLIPKKTKTLYCLKIGAL